MNTDTQTANIADFASQMECERDQYKAHADKLAEALNVAQATIERLKQRYALGSVDGTLDVIFKALAAYESEVRQ